MLRTFSYTELRLIAEGKDRKLGACMCTGLTPSCIG
jgi:hypothetical protein